MARLQRRGIGKFHIDRVMMQESELRRRFEGLEKAYDQLWADAEKCIGDHENSWFWALMFRAGTGLLAPAVRDIAKAMDRSLLSAIMFWNSGMISADELGSRAYADFEKWFTEDFLPVHDQRCLSTDEKLLEELNGYIRDSMESEKLSPITLPHLCTDDYYNELRRVMLDELLPTVEQQMKALVPAGIKDSRFAFIRRRRLCRGVDSFFALKKAQGKERCGFISDVLIGEKLFLDHANVLLHSLAVSIVAEELYLMKP